PPPGAPQAPPPAPGGYGYPGPSGPGAPPPGGPFPQYGAGYPAPPAPSSGGSKKRMTVIVSAVTALVLAVAGGVWFATQGGDGKDDETTNSAHEKGGKKEQGGKNGGKGTEAPKSKDGKLLFGVDQQVVKDSRPAAGMWVTDKVFAKSDLDKVVGYGLTGGKQWEIPLDGDICWAPKHVTADGRTAIVVEESPPSDKNRYGGPCNQIVALDLNNGKKLWQKSVKLDDRVIQFDDVTVGGGTVAAGSIHGGAAWTLDGGKELWKPRPEDTCKDEGYGGGTKLVAVRRCGDYERPQMKVQTLDPANGKIKSNFKVPNGIDKVRVVSTDPLVIGVNAGDHSGTGVSDFMAIDDSGTDGKLRSKVSTESGKYQPRCSSSGVESCTKLAVGKDTLYLPTDEHQTGKADEVGRVNEIVGFNLADGRTKGKADGRVSSNLVPLNVDKDGALIAYQTAGWRAGGTVVRIDPQTFASTVLLKNPVASQRTESQISPLFEPAIWSQGRLYLGRKYLHRPSVVNEGKEYLAMIWGAE
uniref:outer membrane protein assembly factor BamB family protein n=1 Tax=Streptomyces sp. I05A-00742 TaxID=2732853 RepID=UPI001489525B